MEETSISGEKKKSFSFQKKKIRRTEREKEAAQGERVPTI